MPSPDAILTELTAIANDWRWLAITWHVLFAGLLSTILAGWRPSARLLGYVLIAPLLSVSLVAWLSGNPFNGAVFAIIVAIVVTTVVRLPKTALRLAGNAWVVLGVVLIAFGWTYPHFISPDSWMTYVYASPFGTLPCPTLSIAIGITLLFPNLHARSWTMTLVLAGLMYAVIGVFRFGVVLDLGLLLASVVLAAAVALDVIGWRSVRANRIERSRPLPGDSLIREPLETLTHAITVDGAPQDVWPWLIQMGAGSRAGWYSYDFVDNDCHPSATILVPDLQNIAVGSLFPALPGVTEGFTVLALEPHRALILGWPGPRGTPLVTWAFVLEERADQSTRLIVRVRGDQDYRFRGFPWWASKPLVRLEHFLMQRKQLLGIARRVERSSRTVTQTVSLGRKLCPSPNRTA